MFSLFYVTDKQIKNKINIILFWCYIYILHSLNIFGTGVMHNFNANSLLNKSILDLFRYI